MTLPFPCQIQRHFLCPVSPRDSQGFTWDRRRDSSCLRLSMLHPKEPRVTATLQGQQSKQPSGMAGPAQPAHMGTTSGYSPQASGAESGSPLHSPRSIGSGRQSRYLELGALSPSLLAAHGQVWAPQDCACLRASGLFLLTTFTWRLLTCSLQAHGFKLLCSLQGSACLCPCSQHRPSLATASLWPLSTPCTHPTPTP